MQTIKFTATPMLPKLNNTWYGQTISVKFWGMEKQVMDFMHIEFHNLKKAQFQLILLSVWTLNWEIKTSVSMR